MRDPGNEAAAGKRGGGGGGKGCTAPLFSNVNPIAPEVSDI